MALRVLLFFSMLTLSFLSTAQNDNCGVYFRGTDPQLNIDRLDLVQEQLFAHTHKKIKPSLKEKDMVIGNANITRLGKDNYLRLELLVASKMQ